MPKAYYFTHDYNARNDKKISALVREYKAAGYGIFWCVAEMIHEEEGHLEWDDLTISAVSKDLNEDFELVKSVVEKCISTYKLFYISRDNLLTSNRVKRNFDKRTEISKVRSDAGKAGAKAKQMPAIAKQIQAKEKKGKEIKENIIKGKISGSDEVEIEIGINCEDWQYKELVLFISQNQPQFERIRMTKAPIKSVDNFKLILQEFVNKIQSTAEYQECSQLTRHFGHWLNTKNGTLDVFVQTLKNSNNTNSTGKKTVVI